MSRAIEAYDRVHRRAASRLRLVADAVFMGLEGRRTVTLLDLSQSGAKVAFDEPFDEHEGFLQWLEFETFGEIVWSKGLHVGMRFDELLPLDWLVQTRHRYTHVNETRRAALTEAARNWVGV